MSSPDPWASVYERVPAQMPQMSHMMPAPPPPPRAPVIVHEVGSPPRVAGWRLGLAALFFWIARALAGLR
jgi:hypothetical protein